MGQLQEVHSDLVELGYRIIAISPDRPEKVRELMEKRKVDYLLLSDSKLAAARAFGVAFEVDEKTLEAYKGYGIDLQEASGEKHNLLPVPSVFVVGADGIIDFQYVNPDHRARIDPKVLLAAARAAL